MRNEFNELVKELNDYDFNISMDDEVTQKLENLNKKIEEVEKRLVCVATIGTEIVKTIGKLLDMDCTYNHDHEYIQRGAYDIQIAVDLNDTEPIENNWYELFQTETDVVLKGIEQIESDEELTKKFRTRYDTEFSMIKACVKSDMLKKEAINFIKELTKI